MQDIETWAKEFIVAYYSTATYSIKQLFKFYDQENAVIYRECLQDKTAVSLKGNHNLIWQKMSQGSKLVINNYNTIPIENGFNISVFGRIIYPENTKCFSQFFTLEFVQERAVIVSDSLQFLDINQYDESGLVAIEAPKNLKAQQSPTQSNSPRSRQQNSPSPAKRKRPKNQFIYSPNK